MYNSKTFIKEVSSYLVYRLICAFKQEVRFLNEVFQVFSSKAKNWISGAKVSRLRKRCINIMSSENQSSHLNNPE